MQDSRPLFSSPSHQHSTYGTRNPLAAWQRVRWLLPHIYSTSSAAMATVRGGAVPPQWDVSFNQNVMNYAWAHSHLMRLMTERSRDLIKLQPQESKWHLVFIHPIIHTYSSDILNNCQGLYSTVSWGLEELLHVSYGWNYNSVCTKNNPRLRPQTHLLASIPWSSALWHQMGRIAAFRFCEGTKKSFVISYRTSYRRHEK